MGCNEVGLGFSDLDKLAGSPRTAGFAAQELSKLISAFSIPQSGKDINARSLPRENTNTRATGLDPANKSFKIFSAFAPVFRFHRKNNISYIPKTRQTRTFQNRDVLWRIFPSRAIVHNMNILDLFIRISFSN
jgi:hypothetical protein